MDPEAGAYFRVWLTGHSSGGALAQLMALRLAMAFGAARVGGVVMFNSDRVGSAAFARHFDGVLGNRTMRFGYGRGERDSCWCVGFVAPGWVRGLGHSGGVRGWGVCLGWLTEVFSSHHPPIHTDITRTCWRAR